VGQVAGVQLPLSVPEEDDADPEALLPDEDDEEPDKLPDEDPDISQEPSTHVRLVQSWHREPFVPHWAFPDPPRHTSLLSQQPEQEVPEHPPESAPPDPPDASPPLLLPPELLLDDEEAEPLSWTGAPSLTLSPLAASGLAKSPSLPPQPNKQNEVPRIATT